MLINNYREILINAKNNGVSKEIMLKTVKNIKELVYIVNEIFAEAPSADAYKLQ